MAEPEAQDVGQVESGAEVAESVFEKPSAVPLPKRRGMSVFLGLVGGGALAAMAGFGLARYIVPEGWPLVSTAALEAKMAEQSVQIVALKAELAKSGAAMATYASESRVAELESALANVQSGPATDRDESRIAAIEGRLEALEQRPVAESATPTAAAEAAAQALLAEAEAQAATLKAEAEAIAKTTALHTALGAVQVAVDAGQPFAAQLTALQSAGQSIPESLQVAAEDGVPTLKSLQAAFPDAARLALDAALRANMGETTVDRLTSFLRTQTGVRSLTPRDGADPDAILSRAEAALGTGDLAKTLTELAALPPEAQAAIADWQAQAQKRAQALDGLAILTAEIQ